MSVRFDAALEALTRTGTANVFDFNAPYTLMAWEYPITSIANSIWLGVQAPDWTNSDYYRRPGGNPYSQVSVYQAGSGAATVGGNYNASGWNHFALVRESATVLKGYKDGVLDVTHTHSSVSGRAASSSLCFGDFYGDATVRFDGRVGAVKVWTGALSADQVASEMLVIRPRRRLDVLWAFWPLFPGSGERVKDYSGNGRDWTEVGTLSDEDSPPVPWGAPPLLVRGITTVVPPADIYSIAARQQSGADGSGHLGHRILSY